MWTNIESNLNDKLIKTGQTLRKTARLLTPDFIFDFAIKSKKKLEEKKDHYQEKSKEKVLGFFEWGHNKKNQVFDRLNALQDYPYKEKTTAFLTASKNFIFTHPKKHFQNFKAFLEKSYARLESILDRVAPQYVAIGIISMALLAFGAYQIINSGSQIWLNEFTQEKPVNIENYPERPNYFLSKEKTMVVLNVKVPVFVQSINSVKNITIDFSVRTSTRFARYYLEEKEHKLVDHFFTTVEPVISSFPLEDEGKEVLREKIRDEIDLFLEKEKVEGEVEEVYLLYILGT